MSDRDPFDTYDGLSVDDPANDIPAIGHVMPDVVACIQSWCDFASKCESPIETQLGGRLAFLLRKTHGDRVHLACQYRLGRYRYDFAVVVDGEDMPRVLVECDGRQFHETAAQRANDKLKDEAGAAAGMPVMRFTGSDIYRHLDACAVLTMRRARL